MKRDNPVLIQFFHWYSPADGTLWDDAASKAKDLAAAGFGGIWLPPAYKGTAGPNDVGYGVYDLYDLGEFDQKGAVRTKYGTRQQYIAAVKALQAAGLEVIADTVLNHRLGADGTERVRATPYAIEDRSKPVGEAREIEAYTRFDFPGRGAAHSSFRWNAGHFDAVDHDALKPDERGVVYLLEGKKFDGFVDLEKGNFSFLMGADIDYEDETVRREIIDWGKWYLDATGVDGFRLDAVKHMAAWYFSDWLVAMEKHAGRPLRVIAEYWTPKVETLQWFLNQIDGRAKCFGVPLHYHFHYASNAGGTYDLRKCFSGTLAASRPQDVVTFVENHDTQPLQSLESPVAPWFKPLAYAMILLRREGQPCVFHADYYGARYEGTGRDGKTHAIEMPSLRTVIDRLLAARNECGHGPQVDYLDHPNHIGWARLGNDEHPRAMAVLLSDGGEGKKWMDVKRANATFTDILGHVAHPVTTNAEGWGEFACNGGSVSVWVQNPQ